MQHHVIFIPGLGDHRSYGQDFTINYWRIFGLHAHYLALGWRNKEGFDTKLKKLTDLIDSFTAQGNKVSLCGASAGASAVLAAYAVRPNVNGVITIAGKINNPETIGQSARDGNPDFFEGAQLIGKNLEILSKLDALKNILCIYAKKDTIVPPGDAVIAGSNKYAVPGWNHPSGIFLGIVLGAPKIAHFVKSIRH